MKIEVKNPDNIVFRAINKRTGRQFSFRLGDLYGYEGEENGIFIDTDLYYRTHDPGDANIALSYNSGIGHNGMNPDLQIISIEKTDGSEAENAVIRPDIDELLVTLAKEPPLDDKLRADKDVAEFCGKCSSPGASIRLGKDDLNELFSGCERFETAWTIGDDEGVFERLREKIASDGVKAAAVLALVPYDVTAQWVQEFTNAFTAPGILAAVVYNGNCPLILGVLLGY